MKQEHVNSYYAASVNYQHEFPALNDELECDVCIVGAGFSGISSALHLVEKGFKVIVLEAAKAGFGASGRNGGQIVNSYSRDVEVLERRYDKKTAGVICSMIFEGGDIIRQRIKQYDIQCDYKQGGIFASLNNKQFKELTSHKKNWERFGDNELTLLDRSEIKRYVDSDRYSGGLLDNRGGHIHPLNLLLGQVEALIKQGGNVFEQSPVIRIKKGENPVAYTEHGSVKAKYLLLAGNAYMGNLEPALSKKSIPCGTQVIATEPLNEAQAKALLPGNHCVEDCNYLLDYFRLTGDNRLLFGGGVVYGAREPDSIERLIRTKMERVFPQLSNIRVDYAWTGNFLLTYSRMPQFGRFDDYVYYIQGYSGHGVTCTHLAGKLIAEVLTGHAERFDAFASIPHRSFPGGRALQVPLTALGAAYYTLRDKLAV